MTPLIMPFYTSPMLLILLTGVAVLGSGCMAPGQTSSNPSIEAVITVEGTVNSFGAEPFAAVVLNSAERNSWVLELSAADRDRLMMPARVRVTGSVYAADWQGRTRAHMRVRDLILLDE